MDVEQLRSLSRRELQKLAQREKIKANVKSDIIITQLLIKYPAGVPSLEEPAPPAPPLGNERPPRVAAKSRVAKARPSKVVDKSVSKVKETSRPAREAAEETTVEGMYKDQAAFEMADWMQNLIRQSAGTAASSLPLHTKEPRTPQAQIRPLGVGCDEDDEDPAANGPTQRAPSSQATEIATPPRPRRRRGSRGPPVSQIRRQALLATSTYHSSDFNSSQMAQWRGAPAPVAQEPSWPSIPTRGSSRTPSPQPPADGVPSRPFEFTQEPLHGTDSWDDNGVEWRDGKPYRQTTHLPRGATEREALRVLGNLVPLVNASSSLDVQLAEMEMLVDGTRMENEELAVGLEKVTKRRLEVEKRYVQRKGALPRSSFEEQIEGVGAATSTPNGKRRKLDNGKGKAVAR